MVSGTVRLRKVRRSIDVAEHGGGNIDEPDLREPVNQTLHAVGFALQAVFDRSDDSSVIEGADGLWFAVDASQNRIRVVRSLKQQAPQQLGRDERQVAGA